MRDFNREILTLIDKIEVLNLRIQGSSRFKDMNLNIIKKLNVSSVVSDIMIATN